jgi:proteic killer suppression protein
LWLARQPSPVWALTLTRNWRMTFRVNKALEIEDIDLKDDH